MTSDINHNRKNDSANTQIDNSGELGSKRTINLSYESYNHKNLQAMRLIIQKLSYRHDI